MSREAMLGRLGIPCCCALHLWANEVRAESLRHPRCEDAEVPLDVVACAERGRNDRVTPSRMSAHREEGGMRGGMGGVGGRGEISWPHS